MKRVLSLITVVVAALLMVTACSSKTVKGNGNITTQSRSVMSFNDIKASGAVNISVVVGNTQDVSVKTDSNLQSYVETTVKNGVLTVATKSGYSLRPTQTIAVQVHVKNLDSITISGQVKVNIKGIDNDHFDVHGTGTGNMVLSGTTKKASIEVTGTAQLDAKNLKAREVSLDVSGTAQVSVYASRKLGVKISGSGQVTYYGSPPIINQAVFGSGQISKAS